MNKLLIIITLLATACSVAAQSWKGNSSIALSYDNVSVGRNINLTYHQPLSPKWSVYAGLKYHINSKYYRNDYSITTYLFKAFYANEPVEHLGFKGGLQRYFHHGSTIDWFAYYDFQYTRASVKAFQYGWSASGTFPNVTIGRYTFIHQDLFNAYEHTIGLGIRLKVNEQFHFRAQAGVGVNFYRMVGTTGPMPKDEWHFSNGWTHTRQFTLGMEYFLKKPALQRTVKRKAKNREKATENYNSLALSYNDLQTGINAGLTYSHALPDHFMLYGGLSYYINTPYFRDYTLIQPYYFKQFRPENLAEHIGLHLGAEKTFQIPGCNLFPFAFYELQLMRSTVSNLVELSEIDLGSARSSNYNHGLVNQNNDLDYPTFRKYGPVLALQNYIGAGVRIKMTPAFNLKMKGGIGYNVYIGPDHFQDYFTNNMTVPLVLHENVPWTAKRSELSRMFSIGLEYKLGK